MPGVEKRARGFEPGDELWGYIVVIVSNISQLISAPLSFVRYFVQFFALIFSHDENHLCPY